MAELPGKAKQGELLLYQTEDGKTRLQVRLEDETVWLTQSQMADLFQTSIPNVSMHIRNIFREGELKEESVVKDFLTTAADGKTNQVHIGRQAPGGASCTPGAGRPA